MPLERTYFIIELLSEYITSFPPERKRPKQRSSVQHLVIISDASPEIMFLFHFLITLGTTLSLFCAHLKIPSAVSFYPDTRTMTSSQEPAWGGWLARARTLRKASWHPKPGMFSRNTTSLWRRPKQFSRRARRSLKQFCYMKRRKREMVCKKKQKKNTNVGTTQRTSWTVLDVVPH